jgi:hypothetical protein
MRTQPNARLVGAFVLGAVILAITAAAVLGRAVYFAKPIPSSSYSEGTSMGYASVRQ